MVEDPVELFFLEEITSAMKIMKSGKVSGPREVSIEMMSASKKVGIDVMMKLKVIDGKAMSEDCKTSVMVPIYKGKEDITNCNAYRGVKLSEHGMKIIKRVLEKRTKALVEEDDMQYARKRNQRCFVYILL